MSLKREVVSVGGLPNYRLLTGVVQEAHEQFVGGTINPDSVISLKQFVNDRVLDLILSGDWVTRWYSEGRLIKYDRLEVRYDTNYPNALKIIPVWQYEEE